MLYCLYDNFSVNKYKNINSKVGQLNNNDRILSAKGELKMSESINSIMKINEKEEFELGGISKRTKELVVLFPCEKTEIPLNYKVDEMLVILDKIYKTTKKEVKGIFDLSEAYVIIQSFNGYLYNPEIQDKSSLLLNVEDAIFYEKLDELFEVNKEKLFQKIYKLTEAQSFAVIRMAFEALNNEENKDFGDIVKEIFEIK